MGRLKGSTISTLKKYPELLPLWGCIIGGLALASLYTLRLATRNPDVAWRKETNPEPWQEYENKQYKFMNVAGEEPKTQAPKY